MAKKIVVFCPIADDLIEILRKQYDVQCFLDPAGQDRAAALTALAEADGLLTANIMTFDRTLLTSAKNLKIISTISVGYDHFDLAYLKERQILLTNTPDVLTETTADLAFLLLLATARRLIELNDAMKQGRWNKRVNNGFLAHDVHHKKLGIIGFGRIGQAIARRGHFGFGMDILYYNRQPKAEAQALKAEYCTLDELLSTADFVCLAIPLTPETKNMIGAREIQLMRPETIFINIARGQLVDESALIEALQQQRLRGAGLDVFAHEPLAMDSPLLKLPHVVTTPHIGSGTRETFSNMVKLAIENLKMGLEGKQPPNLVNKI